MCVCYGIREWHCSSVIIQINSHTLKLLFNRKTRPKQSVRIILHTPNISLKEITSLPLVWFCSYSKTPAFALINLHFPEVHSWVKTLWTQNTLTDVKSLWIIRKRLFVPDVSHTGQIIRQDETWMCCVWIQSHWSWWDKINRCIYSHAHIMIKNESYTNHAIDQVHQKFSSDHCQCCYIKYLLEKFQICISCQQILTNRII